jgi:hypothetical protein
MRRHPVFRALADSALGLLGIALTVGLFSLLTHCH